MPPRLPTRLLVVRHGRSEWNALNRWQGHADVPLDEVGRGQATQAAAEIAPLGPFAAVWSSDLSRARETAEILAESVGGGPVRIDVRLRENHVGPWEGLTAEEVEHGWPGYLTARRRPEGFEEYDAAARRMLAAFVDIAAAAPPGSTVLIVSHGGIVRASRRSLGELDQHLRNLDGSWFEVDADGTVSAHELVIVRERRERPSEVL